MRRLSYLHSVGTNFASLIYDLPDDANFDKFDEKCKTVESLLENNPKLADSLVSRKYIITVPHSIHIYVHRWNAPITLIGL